MCSKGKDREEEIRKCFNIMSHTGFIPSCTCGTFLLLSKLLQAVLLCACVSWGLN
jgi:hypothetical protein